MKKLAFLFLLLCSSGRIIGKIDTLGEKLDWDARFKALDKITDFYKFGDLILGTILYDLHSQFGYDENSDPEQLSDKEEGYLADIVIKLFSYRREELDDYWQQDVDKASDLKIFFDTPAYCHSFFHKAMKDDSTYSRLSENHKKHLHFSLSAFRQTLKAITLLSKQGSASCYRDDLYKDYFAKVVPDVYENYTNFRALKGLFVKSYIKYEEDYINNCSDKSLVINEQLIKDSAACLLAPENWPIEAEASQGNEFISELRSLNYKVGRLEKIARQKKDSKKDIYRSLAVAGTVGLVSAVALDVYGVQEKFKKKSKEYPTATSLGLAAAAGGVLLFWSKVCN